MTAGRLLTAGLVLLAATLLLWILPSKQYIFLPDVAHPVAPLVTAPGEKAPRDGGGIYFVDVIVRRATLLERLFPNLRDGSTLVPPAAVNPPGGNDAARRKQDLAEMRRSQSVAAAVAERALGYHVVARPTGILVTAVIGGAPAAGRVQPASVIVAVDGKRVRTPPELKRAIQAHRPGTTVQLTVRDGGAEKVVSVPTVRDPRDRNRTVIGILVDQAVDIHLPLAVKIDAGGVGGPSAGLAFALDLMEELGRDVDHGHKVAATGEINLNGDIGQIGGVKQKTIGARKAHVDVFLVPAGDNAREARRYADGLRIVPVQSFRQALHALATLPVSA